MTRRRLIGLAITLAIALPIWFATASCIFVILVGFRQAKADLWHNSIFGFWNAMTAEGYAPWLALWTYWNDPAMAQSGAAATFLALALIGGVIFLVVYPFFASGSRLRGRAPWAGNQPRPLDRGVTDNHGHSAWMSLKEALTIFSAAPRGDGICKVIGRLGKTTLYDNLNAGYTGLTLEFSGSGTGKTSSLITQLAIFRGPRVVLDPACEIGPMTWSYLTTLKQRVCIVSPIPEPKAPDGTPEPWAHLVCRYNPLDWVNPSQPLAATYVRMFARFFFDERDADHRGDNAYFRDAARTLISIILGDILWTTGKDAPPKTLGTLRQVISLGSDRLIKFLDGVAKVSPCPMSRLSVGPLLNSAHEAGKTFAGVWEEANEATMWLTDPDIAYMVSGNDFSTLDICTPTAISIIFHLPLDMLQTNPAIGRVLFGSFVSAKIASGTSNWVLLAPDEPWSVGRAKWMEIVISAGRKHGLAMHAPWLDVGTLERIWGGKSGRSFWLTNARCIMISRLNDPSVAREVAEACGTFGVLAYAEGTNSSRQMGGGWGRVSRGRNLNRHEIKRELLMPAEVIQDLQRDDLLVLGLGRPLMLERAQWWKYPDLRRTIQPSRYQEAAE